MHKSHVRWGVYGPTPPNAWAGPGKHDLDHRSRSRRAHCPFTAIAFRVLNQTTHLPGTGPLRSPLSRPIHRARGPQMIAASNAGQKTIPLQTRTRKDVPHYDRGFASQTSTLRDARTTVQPQDQTSHHSCPT